MYLCVHWFCYTYTVPAVGAMRGCVVPCIRSMLSKLVPPDKQGKQFPYLECATQHPFSNVSLFGVCNTAPI